MQPNPFEEVRMLYKLRALRSGKFNENHDDAGRFSDGGGGGASGLAASVAQGAAANEAAVTADLQQAVAGADHGAELIGLNHTLKTESSLNRKIASDASDKMISQEAAASQIIDALRYTSQIPAGSYADVAQAQIDALTAKGYGVEKIKNTWGSSGYKGINTVMTTPSGYKFEMQFHTPQSFSAKGSAHTHYEVVRSSPAGSPASLSAQSSMGSIFGSVPIPAGAAGVHKQDDTRREHKAMNSTTYYAYQPESAVVTLYRLTRNADGLMVRLQGANAKKGWTDCHGVLESIDQDPNFVKLSTADATKAAKTFGVSL